MGYKLGMDAKLYYKVGGQAAGGSWIEMTNVKNVTVGGETAEADVTTRGNAGWRAIVATLRNASLEFEMIWDTADAAFTAIKNSWLTNAMIGFRVLDEAAGQGLQADFMVTNFTRNEQLEEAITVNVTVKPTYSANPPEWIGGT